MCNEYDGGKCESCGTYFSYITLDGVLLRSTYWHEISVREALSECNLRGKYCGKAALRGTMSPMSQRIRLLGIPIDTLTGEEACARMIGFLAGGAQHHVLTPNSEMLVASVRDTDFRRVLQEGDLNIPDSAGLLLMARFTGQKIPERVTGVDTVRQFCSQLSSEHSVFLLGAGEGVAERAADALRAANAQLVVAGTFAGSPSPEDEDEICERIRTSGASVLFVAYGAPAQDMWIARTLKNLPSVSIAMGVGGTFDFLAGKQKRAPKFFQRCGLEWLWRLMREPRRIGRIVTAVIVFPLCVLRYGKNAP
ncbi:acetylglucosaminyldiphospho-UDP acetyl-beta-D-mannosaminyltransferase [Candidatus Peregrinibacteria bacterium CG10_big_fil_rev_8_21_14_0_10_49_24]|nr:MAG: acetylglucosaminyldiphospho-UDP acetyl-beta-D-mannosaminyltransferase [Candidatus Peregrinibacteria bacterium CG11_big_fil_rev_8_21_14_0_20_49_14]PIR51615.1 MAG: acetylglucosaminyldiphospho-UDP acetyl-beta-D-mannosaminyltransferase [Candidatus Peregrinibacteria bacterium CG10_big_fil_rev_8_21_14_0_10_49_24]PJA68025.1 MAG: acetylglucosaminyldiphospho-UDP acetyl-beta-D-mannosaminyltransferase [Candidatus Peregrinibacteria bacterium CG_4_9_14_3_um_filter_49_12]